MKIVEINAVYGHGSTGTIVRDIEETCRKSGMECYVASPDPAVSHARNGYLIGNRLDHKLHALLARINGKQAYFSRLATKNLLKWLDEVQPDIIHLHNLHSNFVHLNLLLQYLAERDIRTIITFHDCWFFTGGCFHFIADGCERWQDSCGKCPRQYKDMPAYFKDCSAQILADRKKFLTAIPRLTLVGVSQWVADECRKSCLKNCDIRVIHNGFDLDIFKPAASGLRREYGLEGKFVILAPASKWYAPINRATYDFFRSQLTGNMSMVFFGCAELHHDLPENVKEIGYIRDPHKMAELYSMADVMVNCSRADTLPGINLECQACGTPVVTYDATGCKETVDNVCGFAVPAGDHEALFKAMLAIKEQGKARVTTPCEKFIRENFMLTDAYRKYNLLFTEQANVNHENA